MKKHSSYLAVALALLWAGKALAEAPDWQVNPASFELSAALTGILLADFEPLAGAQNQVAAFVGGEVRGVATPVKVLDQWMVFLTLYGRTSGEELTFEIYIAAEDAVFSAQEKLPFQANTTSGSPSDPFALNAIVDFDYPPSISPVADQVIEVGQSFAPIDLQSHLQSEDNDPVRWSVSGANFARPRLNVSIGAGDLVEISPPATGWTGTDTLVFTAVEQTEGRLTALVAARFTVRLPDRPPTLGAIPDQRIRQHRTFAPLDLDEFLDASDGDVVAWNLSFPPADPDTGPPAWSVSNADYEFTMSATATISLRGQTPGTGDHLLAAFVRQPGQPDGLGVVRGVARPVYVGDEPMYFLTIYANQVGEDIVFRFYDAESGAVFPVKESLVYTANAILGSPQEPLALQAGVLSYALDGDNILRVGVLAPEWTGSEEVLITAADQGTAQGLASTAQVIFTVEPALTIFGDVNGDEQVTVLDAEWIAEHVLGTRALGAFDAQAADVNGDGRISAFDAALVQQYAAGLINNFPVE